MKTMPTRATISTTLVLLTASACAVDVPSDEPPPRREPPPSGVALNVESATLTASTFEHDRVVVTMELSVGAAAMRASLAEPLFAIELEDGIQFVASPRTASTEGGCPREAFVSAGASARCALVFDVTPGARAVLLHYVGPDGMVATAELPEVEPSPGVKGQWACARVWTEGVDCDCFERALRESQAMRDGDVVDACHGELDYYADACDQITEVSDACAEALAAPYEDAIAACEGCPETPQTRAHATCLALFDAIAASDDADACLECFIDRSGMFESEVNVHCGDQLESSGLFDCSALRDVDDACADAATSDIGALRSMCDVCS